MARELCGRNHSFERRAYAWRGMPPLPYNPQVRFLDQGARLVEVCGGCEIFFKNPLGPTRQFIPPFLSDLSPMRDHFDEKKILNSLLIFAPVAVALQRR